MDPNQNVFSYHLASSPDEPRTEAPQGQPNLLEVPDPWASRASSPTQYEFITTTGDESSASTKRKLKTVRSHVMKNFLQQQQRQRRDPSETMATSSVGADRRKGKQRVRSTRSASVEGEQTSPGGAGSSQSTMPEYGMLVADMATFGIASGQGGTGQPIQGASSFATEPGGGGPRSFALDFFWNADPPDDASRYSLLQLDSISRDQEQGRVEPSVETLNYIGETVRTVMETLQVRGRDVPQSIIFAVSQLALGSVMHAEWDQAKGHMAAMNRIVDLRGGVSTLDFELQRTITSTSYLVESVLVLLPNLPIPRFPNVTPFPLPFQDECSIRAWRMVKRFPKNSSFLYDVLLRLHQVGLAVNAEWASTIDQRILSNVYFEAMNALLLLQVERPWLDADTAGPQGAENDMAYQALVIGSIVNLRKNVRHLTHYQKITISGGSCEPTFARLKAILEGGSAKTPWPRGRSVEPILFALVLCFDMCTTANPWRTWFKKELGRAVDALKLRAVDEFRKALEMFPLAESFRDSIDDVWREVGFPNLQY